jgi:hypothetical protein
MLILELLAGAVMDLWPFPYVVQDLRSIGYPTYVLYIVGVWKVLAVGTLLWRRFPRLVEWAYAGIFFEMTGAVVSHVLVGDPVSKYAAPLAFTVLTLVSWWSQPSREPHWTRQTAN